MSNPEATALAMAAATTIVTAMATSAWQATRAGVARIFGRAAGDESGPDSGSEAGARAGSAVEVRLERSAARIAGADDPERVRQAQIDRWRDDIEDLLLDHPDAAAELAALVEAVRRQLPPVGERWVQRVEARDGGFAVGAQGPGSSVVVHRDRETPPTGDAR
ncbi:hypothetical protein ACFYU9_19950 [Streptomyces sp. NPDC004327]|uniref:hypothetical protein n=1 Tax=Streptomyces sp. NPDC004327 TaxID=3364699 RepID=UPI0036C3B9F8